MDINQGQQKFNLMLSEIQPINRIHLMKTLRESCGKYKFYSWEIAENYSYITYLTNFRPIFDSEAQRKRVKVFHHLSKLIKTRTPEQIKSHHQKMLIKYKTIDQIIRCLRVKIFSELQLKEQLIPVIEQINKQAQQFCLSQKPLLKFAPYDYPEKNGKAMDKEKSELFEAHGVKIEEAPKCYITSLVKIEENPSAASLIACLKQEEEEDMVIRLNH